MHVRINFLLHVVVLVVHLQFNSSFTIFLIHLLYAVLHETLTVFEVFTVVVTDDIAELCFFTTAFDTDKMIEALIAFCLLWYLCCWDHVVELTCQTAGINHLSLGITCMNAYAMDKHLSTSSIEVLIFKLTEVATINGIAPFATKLLYIKVMRTHTNLFVWVESNTDVTMFYLVVVTKETHSLYYLSYTCLVVSTQQCRTVCYDEVFSLML